MARSSNRYADAVASPDRGRLGCGLLGCLGGLIAGLLGGAILLALVSFLNALTAPLPVLAPALPNQANIRITITEDFLNRFIESPTDGGTAQVNLLPNNQLRVTTRTTLPLLALPVEIVGLFQLQAAGQTLEVRLLDTQVTGVDLPPEMQGLLNPDISAVNQDLSQAVEAVSQQVGAPVVITGLETTETELRLELREFPGGIN